MAVSKLTECYNTVSEGFYLDTVCLNLPCQYIVLKCLLSHNAFKKFKFNLLLNTAFVL